MEVVVGATRPPIDQDQRYAAAFDFHKELGVTDVDSAPLEMQTVTPAGNRWDIGNQFRLDIDNPVQNGFPVLRLAAQNLVVRNQR
jgi:hypothetical protein